MKKVKKVDVLVKLQSVMMSRCKWLSFHEREGFDRKRLIK